MFNLKQIKYTLRHRKAYREVEKELLGRNTLSGYLHDLDKVFLYLFFDYQKVHNWHRSHANHHSVKARTEKHYMQMVIDWESARRTKPDKSLNAYETLNKYYPQLTDKIMPILVKYNLDHRRGDDLTNNKWSKDYGTVYIGFDESIKCKSYSTLKVFRDKGNYVLDNVSENTMLYWCSCDYFDTRLIINKASNEGICINNMIENRESNKNINKYLLDLLISKFESEQFLYHIKEIQNNAFRDGYIRKTHEIAEVFKYISTSRYSDIYE